MGCGKSTSKVTSARALLPGSSFHSEAISELAAASRPHRDSALQQFYLNRARLPLLRADYMYGYNCRTTCNNLFYLEVEETVAYPCGAVGVLLGTGSNTQRYLGGGEVHSAVGHSRAVVALAVTQLRDFVATGEEGLNPVVCVWKPGEGLSPVVTLEPGRRSLGIALLGFSHNSRFLCVLDSTPDQTLFLYDWRNSHCFYSAATGPSPSFYLAWAPSALLISTVSKQSVSFWTVQGADTKVEKGRFDSENETCWMTTVQFFNSGAAVTGDVKGRLHLWTGFKEPAKNYQILEEGKGIRALAILADQIIVGGEDNKVHVYAATFKPIRYFETPAPPVSVDFLKDAILCGLANGSILEFGRNGRIVLMDSHSTGHLHSIALDSNSENMVSTGDDNYLKAWNIVQHRPVNSGIVEVQLEGQAAALPRVVAMSKLGCLAVGHSDGHVTIRRNIPQINHILACMRAAESAATAAVFSPSGKTLALGTYDGFIYLYDVLSNYSLFFRLEGGDLPVVSLEWNEAGDRLLSIDSDHTERLWNTEMGSQMDLTDQAFMPRFGHFPAAVTSAPSLCFSKAHKVGRYVQGTAWGVVEVHAAPYNTPPSAYRMHAGEVRSAIWTGDDSVVLTASGADLVVVQWAVTDAVARAAREGW